MTNNSEETITARYCENCGDDPRLADDPVNCGHWTGTYCSPLCSRVGCGECYSEHLEDS